MLGDDTSASFLGPFLPDTAGTQPAPAAAGPLPSPAPTGRDFRCGDRGATSHTTRGPTPVEYARQQRRQRDGGRCRRKPTTTAPKRTSPPTRMIGCRIRAEQNYPPRCATAAHHDGSGGRRTMRPPSLFFVVADTVFSNHDPSALPPIVSQRRRTPERALSRPGPLPRKRPRGWATETPPAAGARAESLHSAASARITRAQQERVERIVAAGWLETKKKQSYRLRPCCHVQNAQIAPTWQQRREKKKTRRMGVATSSCHDRAVYCAAPCGRAT